jgi:HEAT repeat protein
MALVRAADPVFRQTINQSAMTVLYLPVPAGLRQRAKTILEIAYAASFGLLGLVFLVSQRIPGWSYVTWSFPVLGFVALWLLLLRWGRPQYRRALAENLRKRRLDFANAAIDISDETTVQVLASALRSPDELLVVHTLELIAHARSVDWTPHLAPLLGHPSAEIRTLALRQLEQSARAGELSNSVAGLLNAPECSVRAAAVSAVSAFGGPLAGERIAPFLEDPHPSVRRAALVALSRDGDPKWEHSATVTLNVLLNSADPDDRCEGAGAIAALKKPEQAPLLLQLLASDAPARVRISAMRAAGALRCRTLLSPLIAGLGYRPVAAEAAATLALYGPGPRMTLERR